MDGILLLVTEVTIELERGVLTQMAERLRQDKEAEVVEVAVLDENLSNLSHAVLSCVKKGVIQLTVIPVVQGNALRLQEIEEQVREEALSFRGMSIQFAEPVIMDEWNRHSADSDRQAETMETNSKNEGES